MANAEYFLQCIEGEDKDINSLFQTICKDPRHQDITHIKYAEIVEREFSEWSMGCVLDLDLHTEIISKFGGQTDFNPYRLSAKQCIDLLTAFSKLHKGLLPIRH